ncbi:hypothetical protein GW17_00046197 [Ensete ventricosum]|nr:hypothetical protein GW17_00046197 [Ensete ventricosum]
MASVTTTTWLVEEEDGNSDNATMHDNPMAKGGAAGWGCRRHMGSVVATIEEEKRCNWSDNNESYGGYSRGTGVLRQQAGEGWEEDNLGCRGGRGWKRGRKVRTTGGSGWATTEEKGRWYGLQTRRQQRGEKGRWCGLRPRRQQHGEKGRWQRQVVAAKDGDDDNDGNVDGKESSCGITTRKPRIAL